MPNIEKAKDIWRQGLEISYDNSAHQGCNKISFLIRAHAPKHLLSHPNMFIGRIVTPDSQHVTCQKQQILTFDKLGQANDTSFD